MSLISRSAIVATTCAFLLVMLTGCGPRGETKTLDEVLTLARDRYTVALQGISEAELRSSLDQISGKLEGMTAAKGPVGADATSVSKLLGGLTMRAGFTARPALTELSGQYREVGGRAKVPAEDQSRIKLLVTRTYNLLASELESTQFKVVS